MGKKWNKLECVYISIVKRMKRSYSLKKPRGEVEICSKSHYNIRFIFNFFARCRKLAF